jgi:hypothetical protein
LKELSNYINEKLDINKVNLTSDFPIDKPISKICDYLSKIGFKQMPFSEDSFYAPGTSLEHMIEYSNEKIFLTYKDNVREWVRFGDLSKPVTKENPVFFINNVPKYYLEFLDNGEEDDKKIDDKKKFTKLIFDTLGL